jgi:hypothetical protein
MESTEGTIDRLDRILLSVRIYCHPDAPREYVVVSRDTLQCGGVGNQVVAELCRALELGTKASVRLVVRGREVELTADPVLGGRLVVFVRREPGGGFLTFREVYEVLQTLESTLGVRVTWGRPFPRGSC